MEVNKDCKLICKICQKEFSSISTKNRHIRKFHDEVTIEKKKIQRIRCPLCLKEENITCYNQLIEHLKQLHKVEIMEYVLSFRNFKNFEAWRAVDNRDVNYACYRKSKHPNGDEHIYYNCNRSDSRGFTSTCHKRSMKLGGSIRIQGICPSRIVAKIRQNGMVEVKFVETHVGHADDLRSKRLSKTEQDTLVEKLTVGPTKERMVTRGDRAYSGSSSSSKESDVLRIDEPTTSQIRYQNDSTHENRQNQNSDIPINFDDRHEIALDGICRFGRSLDEESFDKFMMEFNKIKDRFQRNRDVCRKRKVEEPLDYPNKK